jgi:PAS domain S-box-containing protein
MRVLLIDDNPDDRELVKHGLTIHLTGQPIEFLEAVDLQSLQALIDRDGFDVTVTDYQLRWATGIDVLEKIKIRYPHVPVIMFTATGNEEIAVEAMKAGLDDYVIKSPRNLVRLSVSVQQALHRVQERKALAEAEGRYRVLFEGVPIGLFRATTEGMLLDVNTALVETLDYPSREALLERNLEGLFASKSFATMWWEGINQHCNLLRFEAQLLCSDKSKTWVEINARCVRNEYGEIEAIEGSIEDITERREAVKRVGHLQQVTAALSQAMITEEVIKIIAEQAYTLVEPSSLEIDLSLTDAMPTWAGTEIRLPLRVDHRVLGAVILSFEAPYPLDGQEQNFILSITQQVAQALERTRLTEQAQEAAAHEERQRLARDLHDAVSQTLFAATTIADSLPILWERNPSRAMEQLTHMVILNRAAMAEMRTLLLELRPEAITRTSLQNLMGQLVMAMRGQRQLNILFEAEGNPLQLPPDVHVGLYRIAQESLNNAVKHGKGNEINVRLTEDPQGIELVVTDNGRGFDTSTTTSGLGLGMMRERAAKIGASLSIESATGEGTTIVVEWQTPR